MSRLLITIVLCVVRGTTVTDRDLEDLDVRLAPPHRRIIEFVENFGLGDVRVVEKLSRYISSSAENADCFTGALRGMSDEVFIGSLDSLLVGWPVADNEHVPTILRIFLRHSDRIPEPLRRLAQPVLLRESMPRSLLTDELLMDLMSLYFRVTESSDGVFRAERREAVEYPPVMPALEMRNLVKLPEPSVIEQFITPQYIDSLTQFEPRVIAYIAGGSGHARLGIRHGSSSFCRGLGSWKYAIRLYSDPTVTSPTGKFWRRIGLYILRKECPNQFGHFWERREYFRELTRPEFSRVNFIRIWREIALADTFDRWHRDHALFDRRARLQIAFENEEGVDRGGLLREWYTIMTAQIMNIDSGFFQLVDGTANTYRIQPDILGIMGEEQKEHMRFIGEFLARSLIDKQSIPVTFTPGLYKYLLNGVDGTNLDLSDCEAEDPEMFARFRSLVEMDRDSPTLAAILEYMTFEYETNEFGTVVSHELIPGGAGIPVTVDNRAQFFEAVCRFKLTDAIRSMITPLVAGFHSLLPANHLRNLFSPTEMRSMFLGEERVDVEDLIANTEVASGYTPESPTVGYLFDVLRGFSQDELRDFLQFVTGSTQVPLGGFRNLRGRDRQITPFRVVQLYTGADNPDQWLPVAHTCFNRLDIPEYTSREILEQKLRQAIEESRNIFGEN
jgi:hypothetical protein